MATKRVRPQDLLNVPGESIAWFDDLGTGNEYAFLSNFWEGAPLVLAGVHDSGLRKACGHMFHSGAPTNYEFKTGEHAFAAMKAWGTNMAQFEEMVNAPDPNTAKVLGRTCDLRSDWEVVKLDLMAAIVRTKFSLTRDEGFWLLDTGDALLTEGTFWGDDVWGVAVGDSFDLEGSPGANWLGTLLMARRAELRADRLFDRRTHSRVANTRTAVQGKQMPAWMKGKNR